MLKQIANQPKDPSQNQKKEVNQDLPQIFELSPEMIVSMIHSASKNLDDNQEYLNQINVFPVADSDTGTNMNYTLKSVLKNISHQKLNLPKLHKVLAESVVVNSRGNSGSLLAGFLNGFCITLAKTNQVTSVEIAQALDFGYISSRNTVLEPKNGTLLDILEVFSKVFGEEAHISGEKNIVLIWKKSLVKAKLALEKTRTILEKMRKAKVVDAGAAGMYLVLDGFYQGMFLSVNLSNQNILDQNDIGLTNQNDQKITNLEFQFCTEFILNTTSNPKSLGYLDLQLALQRCGDSIQIIQIDKKYKIHIHTNSPDEILRFASAHGSIENFKTEDMMEIQNKWRRDHLDTEQIIQNLDLKTEIDSLPQPINKNKHKLLVITDSSADLPLDFEKKYPVWKLQIPVFTDLEPEINLSVKFSHGDFYQEMESNSEFAPKTSKINQDVFLKAYRNALEIAENVLVLTISSGMSATFDSAIRAKELLGNESVRVLDSQTSSAGLGLKIKYIFEKLEINTEIDTIVNSLIHLRSKLKVFFIVDNVKYLERSGRLSKTKSKIAQILNINPLLMLKNGKIEPTKDKIIFSNSDKIVKMFYKKILQHHQNQPLQDLFIVYAGELGSERARKLIKMIESNTDLKIQTDQILPLTHVVGSHTGPGSIGLIFR